MLRRLAILLCCSVSAWAAEPLSEAAVAAMRAEALRLAGERRWPQAIEAGERVLAAASGFYGETHAETARAELFLAEARQDSGDLPGAETHFRRALAVQEKALPPADPALVVTLTRLAAVLKAQHRYAEAAVPLERALELQRGTPGAEAEAAVTVRNLAVLHRLAGEVDRAVVLLERALAMRERELGETSADTIASLAELADLHRLRGDLDAAEPLLEAIRKRSERRYGAESREAAEAWRALALHYEAAQRWPEAIAAASRTYDLHEQLFGSGHPRALVDLFLFARICGAAGEHAQAREYFARLAPWYAAHPEADPETRSEWHRQYALACLHSGHTAEAERLFLESRHWHEAQFGRTAPATLRALGDLWTFYAETAQLEQALDPARELAARSIETLGADAPATLLVSERLAQLYTALGRREPAGEWLRRALDGTRRRFGPEAAETLAALDRLSAWHESGGDSAAAAVLQRERVAALERRAQREAAPPNGDAAPGLLRAPAPDNAPPR